MANVAAKGNGELDQLLRGVVERLESPVMAERFASLRPGVKVQVGFVGEWNSGKSSLINAMLGRKVLPEMPTPTTGSITEIEPHSQIGELRFVEFGPEGEEREIDALAFSEFATGQRSGKVRVQVPSQGLFSEGYRFIDTPGLQSLNQTHTDITFGYLPFLDGVVLCHDVARGDLPRTVLDFMARPDVRPILHRFLVVLTCADRKGLDGRQAVVAAAEAQLRELRGAMGGVVPPIIAVSAMKTLEGDPDWTLQDFESAFRQTFVAPRLAIEEERYRKAMIIFGKELLAAARTARESLALDDKEIKAEEARIQAEITKFEEVRQSERNRLARLRSNLTDRLIVVAEGFAPRFEVATPESVEAVAQDLSKALVSEATSAVKRFGQDVSVPESLADAAALVGKVKNIAATSDWLVTLATAVATAAISGGTSLAANAGEAVAGGAGRNVGKQLAKEGGRQAAKNLAKKGAEEAAKKGLGEFLREGLGMLGKVIESINPLEYLGKMGSGIFKDMAARSELPRIAVGVADEVCRRLADALDENVFEPNAREMESRRDALRMAGDRRDRAVETLERRRAGLEGDIRALTSGLAAAED